ncbi:MAG: hypothetical protein ACM3OC_05730 [Deltaproteobacteria bacterium]
MKNLTLILVLAVAVFAASTASAAITRVDKAINVSATVLGGTSFQVQLFKSTSSTTYDWTHDYYPTMAFGSLTNAIANDVTSALTSTVSYLAVVSVINNTGTTYHVQYTGAPLLHTDGTTTLPNNAFTVKGGVHYASDGTTVTTIGTVNTTRNSAGSTTAYNIFTSNLAGASDAFDVFFGLTGDPTQAVSATGNLIPPTQKAGNYAATITLSLVP